MSPVFHPWILFIILLISFILLYISYKPVYNKYKKFFLYLFFIRFFTYSILLFLLLNITIFQTKTVNKTPITKVYFDNSVSVKFHQSISKESLINSYNNILNKLISNENSLKFKPIIKAYSFGEKVKRIDSPLNLNIDESSTNFSSIISTFDEGSAYYDVQNIIIISDGQSTLGEDPINSFNKINIPIHTIGIGENYKLVDLKITKVNVPTYAIKGESVKAEVTVNFKGEIKQRVNISLEHNNKLIGTQLISSGRDGSNKIVRFQFNAGETGFNKYKVKVSTVRDEININNNNYIFNMNIITNKFKIAILTGAPSFNTRLIKLILSNEPRYNIDHYINKLKFWDPLIANFWKKKYDLVILDNFPTSSISKRWSSDLGRKIKNENSSLALIPGNKTINNEIEPYLKLFGLNLYDSNSIYHDSTIYPIVSNNNINNNPLIMNQINWESMPSISSQFDLKYDETGMYAPAFFNKSEFLNPIFLIGKNSSQYSRKFIINSPSLWNLYFKSYDETLKRNLNNYFEEVFKWLVSISGEDNRYFRLSNKSSIQIGEEMLLEGNFLGVSNDFLSNNIWWRILLPSNKIKLIPLIKERDGVWRGRFVSTEQGEHNYWVVLGNEEYDLLNSSKFEVNEGLLELKNVFLNKKTLEKISKNSNGNYFSWDDRNQVAEQISHSSSKETFLSKISFSHSPILLFFILILLFLEWVLRRKIGFQ